MRRKGNLITIAGLAIIVGVLILAGCSKETEQDSHNLSENEELKKQTYMQILNNKKLFNEFMNRMMENTQSMVWCLDNKELMKKMYAHENIGYVMEHHAMNEQMINNMVHAFRNDTANAKQWEQMMRSHLKAHENEHEGHMDTDHHQMNNR